MAQDLYSVEQVAGLLGLHVRTVRNYVREGRLKAVRIGKQYRISREDLETFTGRPVEGTPRETARRNRHVEASSIVEIDAIDRELTYRITTFLTAVSSGRHKDGVAAQPLRIDTIYDEERARLKLIITGDLTTTRDILGFIQSMMEK